MLFKHILAICLAVLSISMLPAQQRPKAATMQYGLMGSGSVSKVKSPKFIMRSSAGTKPVKFHAHFFVDMDEADVEALKVAPDLKTAIKIVKSIKVPKSIKTGIQCELFSGRKLQVKAGHNQPVMQSVSTTRGRQYNTKYESVGTIVSVIPESQGDGMLIELAYETSFIEETSTKKEKDDTNIELPTTAKIEIQTSVLLMPGKVVTQEFENGEHTVMVIMAIEANPAPKQIAPEARVVPPKTPNKVKTHQIGGVMSAEVRPDNQEVSKLELVNRDAIARMMFTRLDSDGDQMLTGDELEPTKKHLNKLDVDNNREVDMDEFKKFVTNSFEEAIEVQKSRNR